MIGEAETTPFQIWVFICECGEQVELEGDEPEETEVCYSCGTEVVMIR